jgi:hypothetical protein
MKQFNLTIKPTIMNTLKLKFPSGVNIDTETKDKLIDNGWKIEYCEPTPPNPKWLPIDKDNLPLDRVVVMNIIQPTQIFTGTLELNRYDDTTIYLGNGQYLSNFTHYIPLSDLLNLPIAE